MKTINELRREQHLASVKQSRADMREAAIAYRIAIAPDGWCRRLTDKAIEGANQVRRAIRYRKHAADYVSMAGRIPA
jgi:hypothetical protein